MESFKAVIEIVRDSAGVLPIALMQDAYRASILQPVALVLTSIEFQTVDAYSDREVERAIRVKSICYLSSRDPARIARAM